MDAAIGGPLFPRAAGDGFADLPPSVRALHLRQGRQRYAGQVEVERGKGWLARLFAAATRLPPAGRGPLLVEIDADARGERWVRHIGGRRMPSRLWFRDGLLCEQLGLARFGFRLDVEGGALAWRVARVHALGIPLPLSWFGEVRARESEQDGRYRFDVRAVLPGVGLLVHYRGWLDVG
ncbi:DUF4166 domain-containing protein [Pseudoxanthomonas wuyuanensis]|uniref:DUF4166 domain-containing protein n=1 Tax=Pseudoxanthomonas wuyuanensis TaxID=1073196 RepID=UPI000BE395D7|nr:DUF4166 domain-containing protein [Pseudoxanthomonas wuyuanensis]KAF1719741.1 DUF4166 domain-containing protein [Pseudoxanthomonas wuyuanensis]